MTVSRRKFVAGITGTGITIGLAGCSGSQELELTASPARYTSEAVSQSPYLFLQKRTIDTQELLAEFTDINAEVTADSYLVTYGHEQQLQGAAVLSTPSVSLGGKELNPLTQDIENVIEYTVRFANSQSEQTNVTVQDYSLKEELTLETTLGEQTGYVYEITAQTKEFGKAEFETLLVVHEHEQSVILTAGAILTDLEEAPEEVDALLENTEEEFNSLKQLLEQIDHPTEWDTIGSEESDD